MYLQMMDVMMMDLLLLLQMHRRTRSAAHKCWRRDKLTGGMLRLLLLM